MEQMFVGEEKGHCTVFVLDLFCGGRGVCLFVGLYAGALWRLTLDLV